MKKHVKLIYCHHFAMQCIEKEHFLFEPDIAEYVPSQMQIICCINIRFHFEWQFVCFCPFDGD